MKKFFSRPYPVTDGLLLVTGLVFLVMQLVRFGQATWPQTIYDFGGMYGQAILIDPSQLWRLVTPIFVHIGWEHLAFNSLALWGLGHQLEGVFGSRRFLLVYLLSGIMGNAFVFCLTPSVVGAGASTSLFGLFAGVSLLRRFSRSSYIQALGQRYVVLLGLNLILGLFTPSISLAGHVGGAIGGCLVVLFLPPRMEKDMLTARQTVLALLAYLGLLLLLVGLPFLLW